MKYFSNTVFVLSFILLFCSCSSDLGNGGTGTGAETTNGIIASSTGKPIANAKVMIIDKALWHDNYTNGKNLIYDSTFTDSTGYFAFNNDLPELYNIQIDNIDEGILVEDGAISHKKGDTLRLKKCGAYIGTLNDSTLSSHTLFLAGTNYHTTVKSNGHFSFSTLSQGTYPVFADPVDSLLMVGVLKVKEDCTITHNNIPVLKESILIEDFQSGEFEFTVLGRSTGSEWYVYNDKEKEHFNSIQSTKVSLLEDGEYALHFTSFLKADYNHDLDSLDKPYTGIGFTLGESYVDLDTSFELSEMDSITFRAKGYGVVRIKLGDEITDSVYAGTDTIFAGEWNDFGYYFELQSSTKWKTYTITPDMLNLAYIDTAHDITWDKVSNNVIRIEFEFNGKKNGTDYDLHLWLDDIMIHGINLEQLIKYRKRR